MKNLYLGGHVLQKGSRAASAVHLGAAFGPVSPWALPSETNPHDGCPGDLLVGGTGWIERRVPGGNGATPQEPGEERDTPINMLRAGDVHRHPPMALEDSPFAGERKWFIPLGFFGSPSPGLEGAGKTSLLYQLKLDENVRAIPVLGFNVEAVEYKNLSLSVSWCGISIRTSAMGGGSQIGKHLFC